MRLKYIKHYDKDDFKRIISTTYLSFTFNLCIGIIKLLMGVIYSSYWFIITAVYYLILSLSRGHLLHSYSSLKDNDFKNKELKEMRSYYRSGYFLIVLGVSYLILCIWMFCFNEKTVYPEYILYGVAAISFSKIGCAITGLIKSKKNRSPILKAIKIMNMADACVSIVAIQCALLTQQNSTYASSSSALLGIVVSLMFIVMGIYMNIDNQQIFKKTIHS
ncbi:MAG: hypothetical protein RR585_07615 [Coprobacillus sp.]